MFVGAKRQNATKWRPPLFDDRPTDRRRRRRPLTNQDIITNTLHDQLAVVGHIPRPLDYTNTYNMYTDLSHTRLYVLFRFGRRRHHHSMKSLLLLLPILLGT